MRELGLVTIFWDINVGSVGKVFSEDGHLLDEAFVRRSDRFIRELIWMSKTLQYGREHVTIDEAATEVIPCSNCGAPMTHHADKLVPAETSDTASVTASALACASCGTSSVSLTNHEIAVTS